MRALVLAVLVSSGLCTASESEVFHGWSKDGSWLVYEARGHDERVTLYFCQADGAVRPTWPAALNDADREDNELSCVRFLDPNKAPYQWKNLLVRPDSSRQGPGLTMANELVVDGETPGFVLQAGDKKQVCYASGTREDSRLGDGWFHPSGKYAAAMVDGAFHHCVVTLKPVKARKKR